MKTLFKYIYIAILVVVAACTRENDFASFQNGNGGATKTCRLIFDGSIASYDGTTRAGNEYEWKDGDKLYLNFTSGSNVVTGSAVYEAGKAVWTLNYSGTLQTVTQQKCAVYFFENKLSGDSTVVELATNSAVYECTTGLYNYNGADIVLSAHLAPKTGRVRFVSDSLETIAVDGIMFYKSYNIGKNSFNKGVVFDSVIAVDNEKDGKYTSDYIYGFYSDTTKCEINIYKLADGVDFPDSIYVKSFPKRMLSSGSSGYITVPGTGNNKGWDVVPAYDYVDLGLPSGIKWATCNIGADSPEDFGDYFAWGEIAAKNYYDSSNSSTYGKTMGDISGDVNYDAARSILGSAWRIPTIAEFKELKDNCVWEDVSWTDNSGNENFALLGTSKINGNSILIPYTGYFEENFNPVEFFMGYYWSSTPASDTENKNAFVFTNSTDFNTLCVLNSFPRYCGASIRPVFGNSKKKCVTVESEGSGIVTVKDYQAAFINIDAGTEITLVATPDAGANFYGWFISGVSTPVCTDTVYTFVVNDNIDLVAKFGKVTSNIDGYEYVDLGLPSGIKWAAYNVGTTVPEGAGNHYAWGETSTKSYYSTSNSATYGVEGIAEISENSQYDVARVLWGKNWRMPRNRELQELVEYCTLVQKTINGVQGYKLISKINGRSIFLPVAGEWDGSSVYEDRCVYWSATPASNYNAYCLNINNIYTAELETNSRASGVCVRPISGGNAITLNIKSENGGVATIKGYSGTSNIFKIWDEVTLEATPQNGYLFKGWYVEGSTKPVSVNATYTFVIDKDVALVAKFEEYNHIGTQIYIDLGLPSGTMWATCNVGATSPEGYGSYYAWGEITTKSKYTESNYTLSGIYLGDISRDPAYDVSRSQWGNRWCMPTHADFEELFDNCTLGWTTFKGTKGYTVTSNINGNCIFLPAAGLYNEKNSNNGNNGYYLNSTQGTTINSVEYMFFRNDSYYFYNSSRYYGYSVRPVTRGYVERNVRVDKEGAGVVSIEGVTGETAGIEDGTEVTVVATPEEGMEFYGWFIKGSSTPVSTASTYTFVANKDVSLVGKFEVYNHANSNMAVDLGLPSGTKWAACNIGATFPEEYGNYYAWGEITTKNDYSQSTSVTYNQIMDGIARNPAYDVARAVWGDKWCMPTLTEYNELKENCTMEYTTRNGVYGCKFTSKKNGNVIFLPAAGYYSGTSLNYQIQYGRYWSSTPRVGVLTSSCFFEFYGATKRTSYTNRYYGYSVRAVTRGFVEMDVRVSSEGAGVVSIEGVTGEAAGIENGTEVTVVAVPDTGIKFYGWFIEGSTTPVSTAAAYTFVVNKDVSLVGKFEVYNHGNSNMAVDLGLPSGTKWAACNIGATFPEEYGNYYAWGEINTKSNYTSSTCTTYGKSMNDISGNANYDVAYLQWGSSWRIPTKTEYEELMENCTLEWTNRNGIYGCKFTSKKNGNVIFLPAAGCYLGTSLNGSFTEGLYWSSTPKENSTTSSYSFDIYESSSGVFPVNRYAGRSVRAVCGNIPERTISVKSEGNGSVEIKGYNTATAQIRNGSSVTVVATPDNGYRFEGWYLNAGTGTDCVSSDNSYTFTVTEDVQLIARFVAGGQADNLHNGHEYVDLGLPSGTKWATCNVGAARPEGYGGYYAWGELNVKSSYTSGNSSTYNKSMSDISGNATYDVARATWGGNWRMPTSTELQELINNCTWTNTTLNGVKGSQVTGRNGNSIFLPYSGYKYSTSISHKDSYGIYWSSTPNGNQKAKHIDFNSTTRVLDKFGLNRYDGLTIRPVFK